MSDIFKRESKHSCCVAMVIIGISVMLPGSILAEHTTEISKVLLPIFRTHRFGYAIFSAYRRYESFRPCDIKRTYAQPLATAHKKVTVSFHSL